MYKKWVFFYFFASTTMIFGFQNCSNTHFAPLQVETGENKLSSTAAEDWCVTYPSAPECFNPTKSRCLFNGNFYSEGEVVTAYLSSNSPNCIGEDRVCQNGAFTGSYNFGSCSSNGPASCLFNGQTVQSGQGVTGYQNSTVAFGSDCKPEQRTCTDGVLSGTYVFDSCSVGLPASCIFNNQTVLHGNSVTAYTNSSVPYGNICQSETRTCYNGSLTGSSSYAACSVSAAASCIFNGQTIASGQTVKGYQSSSVLFGDLCIAQDRLCTNGTLSGNYNFGSCTVAGPVSCLFNGQSIASGQSVVSYQNSSVAYGATCVGENRLCMNGVLNGSYNYASCIADAPASCLFNGQTIASGQTVKGYQSSSVLFGNLCIAQDRLCTNGTLSGNYNFGSCTVAGPVSCLFNGQTIASGQTAKAYESSSVQFGNNCVAQDRLCTNGILDGSYNFGSCMVAGPVSCLFNGQTIASGQTVKGYQSSTVAFGSICVSEDRLCTNGILSGSSTFGNCTVAGPVSCLFNGQTIASGQTVKGYQSSTVAFGSTCVSEDRLCTNGTLSGSLIKGSCAVEAAAPCGGIPNGGSIIRYAAATVPYGQSCQSQSRVCNNGAFTGSFAQTSCKVLPKPTCTNGATNYPACNNRSCKASQYGGLLLCDKYCKGKKIGQRNIKGYLINPIANGVITGPENIKTNKGGTHFGAAGKENRYKFKCTDGQLSFYEGGWCNYYIDASGVDSECK